MKPKNHPELTAERLRELLSYDPETGIFRRVATRRQVKSGDIAGSDDGKGYWRIRVNGEKHRAHRLAWLYVNGAWPIDQLDHINGDKLDNRICNLREATNSENQQNRSLPKSNTSGRLGVHFDKQKIGGQP